LETGHNPKTLKSSGLVRKPDSLLVLIPDSLQKTEGESTTGEVMGAIDSENSRGTDKGGKKQREDRAEKKKRKKKRIFEEKRWGERGKGAGLQVGARKNPSTRKSEKNENP